MDSRRGMIGLALCGCLMSAGCREDRDPPRAYEGVMWDGSTALASMPGPMLDARVAAGSAQFPDFRVPDPDAPFGDTSGGAESEALTEVRNLIEEYNSIVDQGHYDDLAEYYIEEQREAVGSLVSLSTDVLTKVNVLGEALKAALPDEKDRVAKMLDSLASSSSLKLAVKSLAVAGDEEVTGTIPSLPGTSSTIRFRLLEYDGETNWYIDSPEVAMASAMKPMIEAQLASWDQIVQAVTADPSTAEQMLQALETAANMAETLTGGAQDDG